MRDRHAGVGQRTLRPVAGALAFALTCTLTGGRAAALDETPATATPTSARAPVRAEVVDVAALLFPIDGPPPEGDPAELVEAAESVTRTLRERAAAARRGAEARTGREVRLELTTGTTTGTIAGVTDDGLVVDSTWAVNDQRLRTTATVRWDALSADQLDELARAGGWDAAPADRAIARACASFASGELDAAERSAAAAAGHVLRAHLGTLLSRARAEAAYRAAMDRARQRMRARDWAGAAAAADEALATRTGDASASALRVEARYAGAMHRAQSYLRRKDWKGAIGAAGEALAAKPGDGSAARLVDEATTALRSSTTLTLDLAPHVSLELVYVKPGTFVMGGRDETPIVSWEGVQKPNHEVEISRGFYLGACEVTRRQFAAFVEATGHVTEAEKVGRATGRRPDGSFGELAGSTWRDTTIYLQTDDHPVAVVNWFDCTAFCAWASTATGYDVRLPTEAEWEFACRAGSTTWYVGGDDEADLKEYAWYSGNAGWSTHPVGKKRPNAWGLYDLHGNVYEWVADWYADDYYARSPRKDPPGPASGNRGIARGGGWHGGPVCCGSAVRRLEGRVYCEPDLGFRVAVTQP